MHYTITQAAEKFGLTAHTLRYYDKEGLLPFVERTESGIRKFKDQDFQSLSIITCLKNTGMPIKQIKQFMEWCGEGDKTISKRLALFLEQKKNIESQITVLNQYMEKIDFKIWYYKTATKCGSTAAVHKTKKYQAEVAREITTRTQKPLPLNKHCS